MRLISFIRVCARGRRGAFLMAAPVLLMLSGADLYVDAEGRVRHNPAVLEREQRFFELRDRADGLRKNPGTGPEQTVAVYEQALRTLGERDDRLRVDLLWRMAETYADAAYRSVRAIGRAGEEALSASGGDVDAMLEAMQEVFEAENKGRPNRHYVEKLIEQYKLVAAESAEIDPLLSARSLMEAARGSSNIREHEQAIQLWNEALQAAQDHLASPSLDADEREEWEKVRLHAGTAIPSIEQIMTTDGGARDGEARDGVALARIGTGSADDSVPPSVPATSAGEALVTLELLSTLRAERDFRKESLRVDGDPFAGTAALVPVGGTTIADAIDLIRRAYEVPMCMEFDMDADEAPPPIQFSIHEGQRLVDALDAMEEASGGTARWRLLDGRIVVTARAEHEVDIPGVLDEIVEVAIEESTLMEALLALEASFNEQHREGLPLILGVACIIEDAPSREPYRLFGRMALREAILGIMSQMDEQWSTYSLTRYERRAAQTLVVIRTRPCAEDRDVLVRLEAANERRLQYQQAIDEARAAAEEEAAESE